MYKIGDTVMYGTAGVCTVVDICVPDIEGATRPCYLLQPCYQPCTKIYAPTQGNSTVAMRHAMSRDEANELIDTMPSLAIFEPVGKDESIKTFRGALQSADGQQLARLVKTLYAKKQQKLAENKPLPSNEKDLLHTAEQVLHGEVAYSLQLAPSEVGAYIAQRIESKTA